MMMMMMMMMMLMLMTMMRCIFWGVSEKERGGGRFLILQYHPFFITSAISTPFHFLSQYRIASQDFISRVNFVESHLPNTGQFPYPVKTFHTLYFDQIPDPKHTPPDPVWIVKLHC